MSKPYTPRPWQAPMTDHILDHPRCAIWAGMGTGKTVATETALEALQLAGETDPVLVLSTKRPARKVWSEEVLKWDHLQHLRVSPIVGSQAERIAAVAQPADIYTTNYENLEWLVDRWGDRWPYRTLVADESTRLKSLRLSVQPGKKRKDGTVGENYIAGQGGKRARALGHIAHTPMVRRFIELTGTPSPNGLKDLWGQIWFLDAGKRLGRTYDAFSRRWFRKGHDGYSVEPMAFADAQIHAAVRDLCLSIDLADYVDVAAPIVNDIYVDLPVKARRLYKDMERDLFVALADRTAEAFNAAAKTQKCLQLANGAVYVDPLVESDVAGPKEWRAVHDAKIEALEDVIEEACGAPVIVVYEFRSDLARLRAAFPKARPMVSEKDEDDFKAGRIPILLAHPASAGHGIDGFQTVCNTIVFFGQSWNLELYDQIIGRIGPVRQMQAGLNRPVYVHHILARDTVDELVLERRATKREVQDILLDAMKRR